MNGYFIISLDFEMMWGMIEKANNPQITNKVEKVEIVIPKILECFNFNNIHATWGIVGLLMLKDINEIKSILHKIDFKYAREELRISNYLKSYKDNDFPQENHFRPDLINQIIQTPHQEIASHSFSHFYSLESGQTIDDFETDLKIFNEMILDKFGLKPFTYIYPRFQHNKEYNKILEENAYKLVRGLREDKQKHSKLKNKSKLKLKFYDRYFNILGHRSYSIDEVINSKDNKLFDLKESYYLRSVNSKRKILEYFKLKRIKNEMTFAAKNNKIFHLWWHPHDFGIDIEKNLLLLDKIGKHYDKLNKKFNYQSKNMAEMLDLLVDKEIKVYD